MDSEYFVVGLCGGLFGLLLGVFILYICFSSGSLSTAYELKPKPSQRRGGRQNPPPRPGSKPGPPVAPPGIRYVKDGIPKPLKECKPVAKKFHEVYGIVGCPKCGHQHRYGLNRPFLDCYLCAYTFDPELEGRRYESYKKENMNVTSTNKYNPKYPGPE